MKPSRVMWLFVGMAVSGLFFEDTRVMALPILIWAFASALTLNRWEAEDDA